MTCRIDRVEVAEYMQSILLELRTMAREADCGFLTYTLELALIEASDVAAGKVPVGVAETTAAPPRTPTPEEIVERVLTP